MKIALLLAVVIVTLSSLPLVSHQLVSQQPDADAEEHGNLAALVSTGAATVQAVRAELVSSLDARFAEAGAVIVLETKDPFEATDGTVIPAGSRLIGHLTEVLHGETFQTASNLSLVLDRAELSGGRTIPFHSASVTLAASVDAATSATGTSAPHNYHLDPGTRIVLGVSANRSAD
jgi:hypothetical protein